jgi:hypothetical protein
VYSQFTNTIRISLVFSTSLLKGLIGRVLNKEPVELAQIRQRHCPLLAAAEKDTLEVEEGMVDKTAISDTSTV